MSSTNPLFTPTSALREQASELSPEMLQKISSVVAAQVSQQLRQEQAAALSQTQLREKRSAAAIEALDHLCQAAVLNWCKTSGVDLRQVFGAEVAEQADEVIARGGELRQKIAEDLVEGAEAIDEDEAELIAAAAEDPEILAELLSAELGQEVTPEEADELAEQAAIAAAEEEQHAAGALDEEQVKEAQVRLQKLQKASSGLTKLSAALIDRRAQYLLYCAQQPA